MMEVKVGLSVLNPTVIGQLAYDYRNAWNGISWLLKVDPEGSQSREINVAVLKDVLASYDCPIRTSDYKISANLKGSFEIEPFLVRCRIMLREWNSPEMDGYFPLERIEASGVLKPLDEAAERVNEALRGLDRIKKMKFEHLTYEQAAEAMLHDESSVGAIGLVRTCFQQFLEVHASYGK